MADFLQSDLSGAKLENSDLRRCNFTLVTLRKANFMGASLDRVYFEVALRSYYPSIIKMLVDSFALILLSG